nr:hypothetical protein [uncultured Duganella sp.]
MSMRHQRDAAIRPPAPSTARLWRGLTVCLLAVAAHAGAAPGFGPRLLLAEKDGRSALLLAESHIGSPAQEDDYFRDVIRPAFAASSALLAERSQPSWFDRAYYQAGCDDDGAAEAALDPALNAALRRHRPAVPQVLRGIVPSGHPETLGRFMRFYMLFVNAHQRAYGAIPADGAALAQGFKIRNAQSGVLLARAPRPAASVEGTDTWLRAYCALAPAQRATLISTVIASSDTPPMAQDAHQSAAAMRAATYRHNDAAYRQSLADLRATLNANPGETPGAPSLPADTMANAHGAPAAGTVQDRSASTPAELALDQFTLVERSRAWIAALPAVLRRERLPFLALGAAHFPDGRAGPGLISLLRDAGYSVALVEDRRALDKALAAVAARPPVRSEPALTAHALTGGCVRDGDNYGCDWSDNTTQYGLLNLPNTGKEAWSACFEREGMLGPEKHCVSGLRAVGNERGADLAASGNGERALPVDWTALPPPPPDASTRPTAK